MRNTIVSLLFQQHCSKTFWYESFLSPCLGDLQQSAPSRFQHTVKVARMFKVTDTRHNSCRTYEVHQLLGKPFETHSGPWMPRIWPTSLIFKRISTRNPRMPTFSNFKKNNSIKLPSGERHPGWTSSHRLIFDHLMSLERIFIRVISVMPGSSIPSSSSCLKTKSIQPSKSLASHVEQQKSRSGLKRKANWLNGVQL